MKIPSLKNLFNSVMEKTPSVRDLPIVGSKPLNPADFVNTDRNAYAKPNQIWGSAKIDKKTRKRKNV